MDTNETLDQEAQEKLDRLRAYYFVGKRSVKVITTKEEINEAIIKKLDRTSTILSGVGGFSGKEKKIAMVSFSMRQYPDFVNFVRSIDREAFITVHRAHEINGEGWTKHDLEENANKEK